MADLVSQDEMKKLREALQIIADTPSHFAGQTPNEFHFKKLAREALGNREAQGE